MTNNKKILAVGVIVLVSCASLYYAIDGYFAYQHEMKQKKRAEYCEQKLKEQEEVEHVKNQIQYYIRQAKRNEEELKLYSDELYRFQNKIDKDLMQNISFGMAKCPTSPVSYEELMETLENCKQNIEQIYGAVLQNSRSCLQEKIKNGLKSLQKDSKKLVKFLEGIE